MCTCASRPGRAGLQSSFLQSRDRRHDLEATAKQRTCFLPARRVSSPLLPAPGIRPSALLGRVPHCLPQDQRPVCPSPPHWPRGDTLTPKDAFCRDGCATPFAFLLLVLCSWGAGEGSEGARGSGGAGRGWARGEQRRPPAHSPSSAKPGASTPTPPVSRVPLGPLPPNPWGSVAVATPASPLHLGSDPSLSLAPPSFLTSAMSFQTHLRVSACCCHELWVKGVGL